MQIGSVTLAGRLALAPMAGVTDLAFRQICREHGAALTVTEMVSTKALCYQDKKTPRLLALGEDEHPAAAQVFGHEPETMAEGAKIARAVSGCDIIDINMGCPAPQDREQRGRLGAHAGPGARRSGDRSGGQSRGCAGHGQVPQGMGRKKRELCGVCPAWLRPQEQLRSRYTAARARSSTAARRTGTRYARVKTLR